VEFVPRTHDTAVQEHDTAFGSCDVQYGEEIADVSAIRNLDFSSVIRIVIGDMLA
jgi:hypothetical protein